ncbi:MAG: hypothetical protein ACOY0T_01025 [Myxococcota bacterium]
MATDELISHLAASGWNSCESIRKALQKAKLPVPTAKYLQTAFPQKAWRRAHEAVEALREHFAEARFADRATFGVLLVPDPKKLDTRGAIPPAVRRDQKLKGCEDFVDERLPEGVLAIKPGTDWTLVATITGTAGIFMGSDNEVRNDKSRKSYTVLGQDTRALMIRQIWGARVLQCGEDLPDSTTCDTWTFTLFCGEDKVDGQSVSGTILHGEVRQRLGKPERRISSARVCPALLI